MRGAPTKFKQEYKTLIPSMVKHGLTDAQVADIIGVTEQTVNNWKKEYPDLFESIKENKAIADHEIEKSLFSRAKGGVKTVETKKTYNKEGEQIYKSVVEKELPPDVNAQRFWLTNRNRNKWQNKVDHGVGEDSKGLIAKYFDEMEKGNE